MTANPAPKDVAISDPLGHGQRAVEWLRGLRHPKSKLPGQAFQLDPWQEDIVRRIYGPVDEAGNRLVRTAVILVPRGARKTTLGAALSLLHCYGPEASPGGEVIIAAADGKQGKIALREASEMAALDDSMYFWRRGKQYDTTTKQTPENTIRAREHLNQIEFPGGTWLEAISSDSATQHGRTPVFALVDELHAHKKRDLFDVVRTGLVKTPGSLLVVITTAGRGQDGIGWSLIDYARKVDRGDIEDPSFLPILYEAPADADWRSEELWHQVNPGLVHGYPDLGGLRQLAREAEARPADRDAFKQLHCNIWLEQVRSPFVTLEQYDRGGGAIDFSDLEGEPCWIGLDASQTTDMTAVVAVFRQGEDYLVLPKFFLPRDVVTLKARKAGAPFAQWVEDGHLITTTGAGGKVIDYARVEQEIRHLCSLYDVQEIAADPAYSRQITIPLMDDGLPVIEFRQGWRSMGPAIQELERSILSGNFLHGGNPVLRWHFQNVEVKDDGRANKSFYKSGGGKSIDGAVAAAMALFRASLGEGSEKSIYASEDFSLDLVVL